MHLNGGTSTYGFSNGSYCTGRKPFQGFSWISHGKKTIQIHFFYSTWGLIHPLEWNTEMMVKNKTSLHMILNYMQQMGFISNAIKMKWIQVHGHWEYSSLVEKNINLQGSPLRISPSWWCILVPNTNNCATEPVNLKKIGIDKHF